MLLLFFLVKPPVTEITPQTAAHSSTSTSPRSGPSTLTQPGLSTSTPSAQYDQSTLVQPGPSTSIQSGQSTSSQSGPSTSLQFNTSESPLVFLEAYISSILDGVYSSSDIRKTAISLIKDTGITNFADLCLVLEDDLKPHLRPIHRRKLLAKWKGKYSDDCCVE